MYKYRRGDYFPSTYEPLHLPLSGEGVRTEGRVIRKRRRLLEQPALPEYCCKRRPFHSSAKTNNTVAFPGDVSCYNGILNDLRSIKTLPDPKESAVVGGDKKSML